MISGTFTGQVTGLEMGKFNLIVPYVTVHASGVSTTTALQHTQYLQKFSLEDLEIPFNTLPKTGNPHYHSSCDRHSFRTFGTSKQGTR